MEATDADLRAELYLRGDTYGTFDAQQSVLNRVRTLEATDQLQEATVGGEWQRIRTLDEDKRSGAIETYLEFGEWADCNGYDLDPAFEQRTRSYIGLDTVEEVVIFPVVSLAIYRDQKLQAVLPCSDEGQNYSVQDGLDAIERGEPEWFARFDAVTVDRTAPRLKTGLQA